ncbi:MBL fold metallo-hydrolase [Roseomonas sp. GC11]|uniref:MBL fold metallo-hydrolase n=1 Tax=Roseomonas sp. GC11 TaxID=2950546 RepID=UPI00210B79A9|nr:MBL fold metallo-hydrolase [Roseomonas sp. GC11]MCQ4160669.1 MBL fold metallo-hydrolase [Roseomonas sp. GC11]
MEIVRGAGVDERVLILRAGEEVDAVLVRTRRFCVLVDTLATPELCARALEEVKGAPLLVVNSHMDWDHFWGNAAVAGAPILAHEAALARFHDPATARTLREKAAAEPRFAGVELVPPSLTFSGEMVLHGGDLTLHLLHTPGHTPDHVAVWIPEIATCLAVDAVEHPIPEVWSDDPADLVALRASLARIAGLGARVLLPAHGQTTDPALATRNIAYFDALEAALRAGQEPSLPVGAVIPPTQRAFYESCHASNLRAMQRFIS